MTDIFSLAEGMNLQGGKYTIVRMLSHGGFGVTYLARHERLKMDVCIKEFFPSLWCNRDAFSYEVSVSTTGNIDTVERFMQKFIKEAQSIAALRHDGIVKIHDVFEENGTAYYVMDYIEGQTLQQLVKARGPLPVDEALGYIRQAAIALGYLHGKHMNHLDIKPANMMIDESGRLTLIDFGVAKHYGDDGQQTTTTPMCISRGYSPIEQYDDGGVSKFSPVTDIYSLGATLYYLLSGTVPPEATKLAVDELEIPDSIPAHIADAILHAMESKPKHRTPTAAAFLADLDQRPAEVNTVASPATEPVSRPRPQSAHNDFHAKLGSLHQTKKPDTPVAKSPIKNKKTLIAFGAIVLFILIIAGVVIYSSGHGSNSSDVKDTAAVAPKENKVYGHTQANTGDLLAKKNGENIYFTPSEWEEVPDKSVYNKLGVVVNDASLRDSKGDFAPFYVAFEDKANGKEMTWYEAVNQFGEDILPSYMQCLAMAKNRNKINEAMSAFDGSLMNSWYWGSGDNVDGHFIDMSSGGVYSISRESSEKVRAVTRIAGVELGAESLQSPRPFGDVIH